MLKFWKKKNNKVNEVKFEENIENHKDNNIFIIKNFSIWYGQKQALFNIDTTIKLNKITAFIGPSGCGKSTLLRSLNRMNDLIDSVRYEGAIYFEGKNINNKNTQVPLLRTRVGMVFQKPTPFPLSIYENVAFGPRSNGINNKEILDQIVEKSLKSAALWEEVKNQIHDPGTSLSGGQQQKLCIARTIAIEPDVILMDEPTSALDPISTSKVEELILELKKKYTIIIVTHSMAQAQRISDYTKFFYKGEIVESRSTKSLFLNPKKSLTKDYINGKIG
ncbi:MAG: phosphate ABC transporter ATP-binding protein PstB [Metamycoplasmataceae bacterium]